MGECECVQICEMESSPQANKAALGMLISFSPYLSLLVFSFSRF